MTCFPRKVKMTNEAILRKFDVFIKGLNFEELDFFSNGRISRIASLAIKASTPPNLLGIERRIA